MQHSCDGRSSLPVPFEAFAPSWFSQNYCYQRSWQTPRDWTQFHFFTFPWTLTLQSYILYGWSPAKNVYTVFVLIHFTLAEELTECSRDGFWCMLASVHQPFCGRWQPVPRKRKSTVASLQLFLLELLMLLKMAHSWPDHCELFACIIHTLT